MVTHTIFDDSRNIVTDPIKAEALGNIRHWNDEQQRLDQWKNQDWTKLRCTNIDEAMARWQRKLYNAVQNGQDAKESCKFMIQISSHWDAVKRDNKKVMRFVRIPDPKEEDWCFSTYRGQQKGSFAWIAFANDMDDLLSDPLDRPIIDANIRYDVVCRN